jgi:Luciferase-like monooxygenase
VLGLDTFGDRTHDEDRPESHAQTIRNVVEQGVLADELGVDFFGIGEHHTEDFPMPAADVVLSAIAARTNRIRLGSAVTVLSSDDPVRVFQRYSTLNAVSGGRAEVIPAAVRASNRSPCSVMTSRTTNGYSRRRPTCSPSCSRQTRHLARDDPRCAAQPGRALPGVRRRPGTIPSLAV